MSINDWIHVVAGIFILSGMALGTWVHPYWYGVPVFVGLNLFQYGITKFCPMGVILKWAGIGQEG